MSGPAIRIASRASRLALWQAEHVAGLLADVVSDAEIEIVHISTTGDRNQSGSLSEFGGQGVFTREVQRAVLDGRADMAVHSLKDLPTESAEGLKLASVPKRASIYDVLVFPNDVEIAPSEDREDSLDALRLDARIGTGSLRRQAQLLHRRPNLTMCDVRGNVETRLKKLDDGQYDALVLAEAGLNRLGLGHRASVRLQPPLMFPAAGQGALGIECRVDDHDLLLHLTAIADETTGTAVHAERRLLAALQAGCHAPLGVCAESTGSEMSLEAVVLSCDGTERLNAECTGPVDQPDALGDRVAAELRAQGADRLVQPNVNG